MKYDKLFVGGDFSGIQRFLYNITSRKAAVSLKGRSASLAEDMKNIYYRRAKEAVIHAGGTITKDDELYCSGGKFFFIVNVSDGNMAAVCHALDECQCSCREYIWKEHRGQLGINICYVAFNIKDDVVNVEGKDGEPPFIGKEKGPGQLWKVVSAGFAQQKNQRFKEYIFQNYTEFFGNHQSLKIGAGYQVCSITGIEFDTASLRKEDYTIPSKGEGEEIVVLPSVKRQIKRGEDLRNDPKKGFKEFEEYATTDKGTKGDTYLAILRMDVDGLGKRFITGFRSLAAYKNFSNQLCDFFEKDVENQLLNNKIGSSDNIYKNYMNVIYAGGDDLFIVGRWDKVIEFAKIIHDETEIRFSNEGISISGGIAIVKPKYPIAKAAEVAGKAEEAAKEGDKNAFHMFGKTLSWNKQKHYRPNEKDVFEHEYAYVEHFKNRFVEYIYKYNKDYGFSKSLLHKIMLYAELADSNKERKAKGEEPNYSYMWHISYYLTRYMEKYKGFANERNAEKKKVKEELFMFCKNLRDSQLPKNKGRNLELMAVAARWAELILQDNNQ